jgi:hypothetical protein
VKPTVSCEALDSEWTSRELLGQNEIISTSAGTGYGGRNSEFMNNYLEITGPNQVGWWGEEMCVNLQQSEPVGLTSFRC